MERILKHAFNSPRLLGVKATVAGGVVTTNISPDEILSAVSASAGKAVLTLGDVFSRPGIVCGNAYSSVGIRPCLLVDVDPTISTFGVTAQTNATPTDAPFNALVLGYDSEEDDYIAYGRQNAPFVVKNSWNSARLEIFKITPDAVSPVINIGSAKATLTRNAVGDYTVTFKHPFSTDNVVAVATAIGSSRFHYGIVSTSATAVRVLVGAGGVGLDTAPFYLVVQGSDNPSIGARERKPTKVTDRLPRLVAGHVSYTGGVPAITKGTGDFTIVDTGTGVLTVNLVNPFAREACVIANQDAGGSVTLNAAATESAFVIDTWNVAGAAADPADIHFMAFGFDDPTEYAI